MRSFRASVWAVDKFKKMKEGWLDDDYMILFDEAEFRLKEKEYDFARFLPGYRPVGLFGWDDFLVTSADGKIIFRVPAVPLTLQGMVEVSSDLSRAELKPDPKLLGKVKWYVKPLVFGGDPNPGENMIWISHKDHPQAVKYWNQMYLDVAGNK